MSSRAAKWIFWTGTLTSLVLFLALTVDTHGQFAALTHADKLDEQVVAGKRAFERRNCNDCHTILGFGAYYAPDLTRAHRRLGGDGIRRRLVDPAAAFAGSFRKMPQQHLSETEVADLVAYMRWVSEIENHDWPPQDSRARWKRSTDRLIAGATLSPSAALVQQESCMDCHGLGEHESSTAPRLEWIGATRDARWIATYLENPGAVHPGVEMPAYDHLSEGQRAMLAEMIVALGAGGGK